MSHSTPVVQTSLIADLETLDTDPTAVTDELGALIFDANNFDIIEELAIKLDIGEQLALGRTFSADTIAHRRRNGTYPEHFEGEPLGIALSRLELLIHDHRPATLWIWGKDFDRPILDSLFKTIGRTGNIPYWNIRCARDEYKRAFGDDAKGSPKTHHAIEDCRVIHSDLQSALSVLDQRTHAFDVFKNLQSSIDEEPPPIRVPDGMVTSVNPSHAHP